MPYPNFTAADFTPSTTKENLNADLPLVAGDVMAILPDEATIVAAGGSIPNSNQSVTLVNRDMGALYQGLPEVLAEIYNNDPNALITDNDLASTGIDPRLRGNSQHLSLIHI